MASALTVQSTSSGENPFAGSLTLETYLNTPFHPDCDFVDGHIEERNVGELEHSWVQKSLMRIFLAKEAGWGVEIVQECRLQISPTRFRIPDSMVLRTGTTARRIISEPPLICIEVISPEDTWKRLSSVLGDYLAMGVPHIWALDPGARAAYRFDHDGLHPVRHAELAATGSEVRINLQEVFSLIPIA